MNVILTLPLSLDPKRWGSEPEARQNIIDLFFRDLLQLKQTQLLESFSSAGVASNEQLEALRYHLEEEIEIVRTALQSVRLEFVAAPASTEIATGS